MIVEKQWFSNYEKFREWALKTGYDQNAKRGDCTIDRIDVDGPYEPWSGFICSS